MQQRQLEILTADECHRLLAGACVGRLVYVDADGPAAIPVNYAYYDGSVLIRVEGGAKRDAMRQDVVGFEVDQIDRDQRSAWSVLARGSGAEIAIEDVPPMLHDSSGTFPEPWAHGVHNVWLQLHITAVTGRRLGAVLEHDVV